MKRARQIFCNLSPRGQSSEGGEPHNKNVSIGVFKTLEGENLGTNQPKKKTQREGKRKKSGSGVALRRQDGRGGIQKRADGMVLLPSSETPRENQKRTTNVLRERLRKKPPSADNLGRTAEPREAQKGEMRKKTSDSSKKRESEGDRPG